METAQEPEKNQSSKANVFLIIAIVLLFLLAITWSIDGSLFYLIGGPIVFFFYLGWRNRSSIQGDKNYGDQYNYSYPDTSPSSSDALTSFIEKKQTEFRPSSSQASQPKSLKRIFVIGIVFAIFFLFFIPIIISLISSGEDEGFYFFNAEQFYNTQAYDSAYANYGKAAKQDPANEEALVGQGNAAFEMNRFDSALIAFDHALTQILQ